MRNYAELVKDLRYCADLDKECLKCKTFEQHDCFNKLGADAADAIEELLAAVPHWISVEERLPEDGKWAIWHDKKGRIQIARYKFDAIDHFYPEPELFQLEDAVAWMPLPEPPKGVQDG